MIRRLKREKHAFQSRRALAQADLIAGAARVGIPWAEAATERSRELLSQVEEYRLLNLARGGRQLCWVDAETEPLVTVRIATYDRLPLLIDRAIASARRQTYERLEILVVGDAAAPPTEKAVRSLPDTRIRFINLPRRGVYPADKVNRWMVAGTAPANLGLNLMTGDWVTPCDDDDELTDDHVEVLLKAVFRQQVEMVYSKARMETASGEWDVVGSTPLRHAHIVHGSVLYSAALRFMTYSNTSWKLQEPADWNLWKRMSEIGVRVGFENQITYTHYLEAYQRPGPKDEGAS